MDTEKLASTRYLPHTLFLTSVDETSTGRQYMVYLKHPDHGARIEVFQPVEIGVIGQCFINVYEAQDLDFYGAILFDQTLTHAILVAGIWNLDVNKLRNEVWS